MIAPTYYGQMLSHVASHGFLVVAPTMYDTGGLPLGKPTSFESAQTAVEVLDWISVSLAKVVPGVVPEPSRLAMVGHSRGAKVAWIVLDGDPDRASAVVLVEPVDGTGGPLGTEEEVLGASSPPAVPALVVGTGLGPVSTGPFSTPCAPEGQNHEQFWQACHAPAWHAVAPDYGHLDMLDDVTPECGATCTLCPAGPDRAGMRALTGGMTIALLRDVLQGGEDAATTLGDPATAPVDAIVEVK
jgi:chlorophyllase